MDGVYSHERGQYSDQSGGMGFPAGFTGKPNARNLAAADNLAASNAAPAAAGSAPEEAGFGLRAPAVAHSGNDWAARQRLKDLGTSASSIMNTQRWVGRCVRAHKSRIGCTPAGASRECRGWRGSQRCNCRWRSSAIESCSNGRSSIDRAASVIDSGGCSIESATDRAAGCCNTPYSTQPWQGSHGIAHVAPHFGIAPRVLRAISGRRLGSTGGDLGQCISALAFRHASWRWCGAGRGPAGWRAAETAVARQTVARESIARAWGGTWRQAQAGLPQLVLWRAAVGKEHFGLEPQLWRGLG